MQNGCELAQSVTLGLPPEKLTGNLVQTRAPNTIICWPGALV